MTGLRHLPGTKGSDEADSELMLKLRRKNAESMQSMKNQFDALESQVRKMSADPRLNKAMVDCRVCGEKGHFGRVCSEWSRWGPKTVKREGATILSATRQNGRTMRRGETKGK